VALDDPLLWGEQIIRENGDPATRAELERNCPWKESELDAVLGKLRASGRIFQTPGGRFLHSGIVERTSGCVLEALRAHHAAHPDCAGLSSDDLLSRVGGSAAVLAAVVDELLTQKRLIRPGSTLALSDWKPCLPSRDQQLCNRVAAAFQKAGWTGPAVADLPALLQEPQERIEKAVRSLAERQILVLLTDRLYLHHDAVESAKKVVLALFKKRPAFTTMDFRDALGVSRKYAVPLLDYLDRARFTVRSGHDRTPGVEARKQLG
jgi:selenocysteine-specific elongation factor